MGLDCSQVNRIEKVHAHQSVLLDGIVFVGSKAKQLKPLGSFARYHLEPSWLERAGLGKPNKDPQCDVASVPEWPAAVDPTWILWPEYAKKVCSVPCSAPCNSGVLDTGIQLGAPQQRKEADIKGDDCSEEHREGTEFREREKAIQKVVIILQV